MKKALTHLMFVGDAVPAMDLYQATFPDFRIERMEKYGKGEQGREGTVKRADAALGDHELIVIDSPVKHDFTFTPSVSLFVNCDTAEELDAAFASLSAGGKVFMPINNYGFSKRFGWCADRFGVSWQLNFE